VGDEGTNAINRGLLTVLLYLLYTVQIN